MSKRGKKTTPVKRKSRVAGYDTILGDVVELLESARRVSARAVNAVMTATYWEIGRRIAEVEMSGQRRADYGERLIDGLATDLTARFGRGFSRRALYQMRAFYLAYPPIVQSAPAQISAPGAGELRALSRKSEIPDAPEIVQSVIAQSLREFPLPWTHYVRLLSVGDPAGRSFYESEALRDGWTVRQLDRQIGSKFHERTLLSKNKAAMLKRGAKPKAEDLVTPEEEIKDPLVLEFLGLKDEYSESDLEEGLIRQLEVFLLELGGDFTFVARQRRLRIGDEWYRIDLLFFHRRLRCLVVIDLKVGKFTHADAGQMHLYLNYAREHWTHEGENPPVGLILCAEKDSAVAHYALAGLPNKVLAAEYELRLPDEKALAEELHRTKKLLEGRGPVPRRKGPRR